MNKKIFITFILSVLFCNRICTDQCPFCNPEVLKKHAVYTGENFFILLNYTPITDGHVMIIPKQHIVRSDGIPSEFYVEFAELVKKTSAVFRNELHADDYFILQKNGAYAGQTVFHAHFHLVPVKTDDSLFMTQSRILYKIMIPRSPSSNKELKPMRNKLRKAFELP